MVQPIDEIKTAAAMLEYADAVGKEDPRLGFEAAGRAFELAAPGSQSARAALRKRTQFTDQFVATHANASTPADIPEWRKPYAIHSDETYLFFREMIDYHKDKDTKLPPNELYFTDMKNLIKHAEAYTKTDSYTASLMITYPACFMASSLGVQTAKSAEASASAVERLRKLEVKLADMWYKQFGNHDRDYVLGEYRESIEAANGFELVVGKLLHEKLGQKEADIASPQPPKSSSRGRSRGTTQARRARPS